MDTEKNFKNISLQDAVAPLTQGTEKNAQESAAPGSIPKPLQNTGPLQSLRTYQGDIESLVDHGKTSITSIAMAEQKREEERPETKIKPDEPSFFAELRNKSFVTAGVIILLLGVAIVGGVYMIRYFNVPTVVPQTNTLVSFNKEINVTVASSSKETVIAALLGDEHLFSMGVNSVLYLNTTDTDSQTFMQLIAPNIPPLLLRSLDTPYMVGVYSISDNEPFIILTSTDYASSFSGMLQWEKTMPSDLTELFAIPADTSTTTPYTFTDEELSNKDVRIVKDTTGQTILLYGFLDKNTIVITTNEDMFTALLGKFVTSQLVR